MAERKESEKINIQNKFLKQALDEGKNLTFYLTSGIPLKGKVKGFDNFTVLIEKDGKEQLIFKHAISTVN